MTTNLSIASELSNLTLQFNNSVNTDPHDHVVWLSTLTQIVCIIIIMCGTIGNTTVLVVFIAKWNSISTYEIFMINLAVADLIGTMVYPNILLHEVRGGNFYSIGGIGCQILYFLSSAGLYISSSTLVMVSIDRFLVIKYPFKHQSSRCRYMIIITWIYSFGCASIYLTGGRVKLYGNAENSVCRLFPKTLNEIITITLTTFILQNVMPILVMTAMYVLVVFQLRNHSVGNDFTLSRSGATRLRQRAAKTMKLLVVIVAVFSLCATPINIFYILYLFQALNLPEDLIHLIMVMLTMLMMTNSCVNPIIYGKLHMTFRRQAIALLHSLFIKPYRYTRRTLRAVSMRHFKGRHFKGGFHKELHDEEIPLKTPVITVKRPSKKSVHYVDSKMIWNGQENSSLIDLDQENRKVSDISTDTIDTQLNRKISDMRSRKISDISTFTIDTVEHRKVSDISTDTIDTQVNRKISDISIDTVDTQLFPMNVSNIKKMLQIVRETNEEELGGDSMEYSYRPRSFLSDLCWLSRINDLEKETYL